MLPSPDRIRTTMGIEAAPLAFWAGKADKLGRRVFAYGADAVYAEWTINRDGDITQTVQCTVCHRRYEPEEVARAPHLPASSEASEPVRHHDQAVA